MLGQVAFADDALILEYEAIVSRDLTVKKLSYWVFWVPKKKSEKLMSAWTSKRTSFDWSNVYSRSAWI